MGASGGRDEGEEAAQIERVSAPERCLHCNARLILRRLRRRGIIEFDPLQVQERILELESKQCSRCGRSVEARAPGVLPKALYGNQLLVHVATQHFLFGQTLALIIRSKEWLKD